MISNPNFTIGRFDLVSDTLRVKLSFAKLTGDLFADFKLAVTGSPALLRVDGPATKDGVRACTLEDDLTDGRWISRKHISQEHRLPTSPLFNWVQSHLDPTPSSLKTITDYRKYNYIFANYQCKVQHRTFEEQVEDVKPERLVFIGDSVTRDQFCLNYGVSDQTRGVCLYEKWGSPYEKRLVFCF